MRTVAPLTLELKAGSPVSWGEDASSEEELVTSSRLCCVLV